MGAATASQTPSHQRSVPGSVNIPIAKLPATSPLKVDDPEQIAQDVIVKLNQALAQGDTHAVTDLFSPNGFWRDHLALTWGFRTLQGAESIQAFLEKSGAPYGSLRLREVALDKSSAARAPQVMPLDRAGTFSCLHFFVSIKTTVGSGTGVVRMIPEAGEWKIFMMYTGLQELKGHEEAIFGRRSQGVEHGGQPGRKNWADRRIEETECNAVNEPAVVILGAGQAGLTIAARLKAIGISSLLVDQNERVGDNWRNRYHQLVLHDPVWFDHLPYMPFPPQWPIFTPKDKLADFFEAYARLFELNVWMKSTLTSADWSDTQNAWTVQIQRRMADGSTQERTLHPRHVIQATGHSGQLHLPSIEGMGDFKGHLLCHSSKFPGARDGAKGKKAIVVGSCNSGHDIAQDFVEKGYDVTMVQRSSTCVISSHSITEIGLKGLYSETSPPVDDSDFILHSIPAAVHKGTEVGVTTVQNELDATTLEGLRQAGFKVDMGPDDAGLLMKYYQRGGGYYIDVGASKLIAEGKIKIKQGQEITHVLPNGLEFADGDQIEADEIVFATGYQNMRTQTRQIFGDKVADRVQDVWGFNEEGEFRTMWQQSGHPGFWFHGGNLALCRFYSRLLALQIKGLEEGLYQYGEE